jgi:hypothetical protein
MGALQFWARPTTAEPDVDEVYWIGSAYYYHLAFERFDWGNRDWDLLPARENPPIAKYVIGLGLAVRGHHVTSPDVLGGFYQYFQHVDGAWGTGVDRAKREAVVRRITPKSIGKPAGAPLQLPSDVLIAARETMIVVAVLTSGLVFLLGRQLSSSFAGLIASQLWLAHPSAVESYNHALSDAVAQFFCASAAVTIASGLKRWAEPPGLSRAFMIRWAVAVGVLLGLACAAKMNALVLLAAFATGFVAVVAGAGGIGRFKSAAVTLAAVAAAGIATFVMLNPAILHDPGNGLIATVAEHRRTEAIQAGFLHGYLTSVTAKLGVVTDIGFRGILPASLLLLITVAAAMRGNATTRFVAGWWFVAATGVTLWIPFARHRYVLPVVIPSVLLVSVAVAAVVDRLRQRLRAADCHGS